MEYSIRALADMAGVTTRTLRYYDRIGLLAPAHINASGYRVYTSREADTLQQILLYKSFGMPLCEIRQVLQAPPYNREQALLRQLSQLEQQRKQIDRLIENVSHTIQYERGEREMPDEEKFQGFKQELVEENERNYGDEIREKYGEDTVAQSNARLLDMSQQQYDDMQAKAGEILSLLEQAVRSGAQPQGEEGRRIAELHRDWLGYTWPSYSREAHIGLGEMYVADARFTAYYDGNVPGCARFLCDAIQAHM